MPFRRRTLRVLMVDDSQDDQFLLEMAFRKSGVAHTFYALPSGDAAVQCLKGEGRFADRQLFPIPDILILDINMPGCYSGLDVLRWLRKHPDCAIIPVIVFSSSDLATDVKQAYQFGANAYVCKPSGHSDLVELVKIAFQFWNRCEIPEVPGSCGESHVFGATEEKKVA
jgi:CheY-like chemotaxis protein